MIDFHTHILPNIDDGSKSIEMSYKMIKTLKSQGSEAIVLSPHYYFDVESIDSFLKRRESALKILLEDKEKVGNFPNLYLGAEVAFFPGISRDESIKDLCIKGTKYMILEMPYVKWSISTLNEVNEIYNNLQIVPIIAHPERFIRLQKGTHNMQKLLDFDVMVQMNCDAFERKHFQSAGIHLMKKGYIDLIGTDSHNMELRAPNFNIGIDYISKKFGISKINEIESNEYDILKSAIKVNKEL